MNRKKLKHAVVTGGTSGIGRATAIVLHNQGYQVLSTGVFEHELEACQQDPAMSGIDLALLDVANQSSIQNLFDSRSQLDTLVNCAGIGRGAEEFTEEGFLTTMNVNLNGTMRCCYAAKELLCQQGGAVVNIASVMSFFGSATGPAYSASKGAVVQFTKSLAMAWAEYNVRVNAVAPGWIETPMTTLMQKDAERNTKVLHRTPMKRWGKAEEIANGIEFLLSDKASFITGVVLPVDGGYMVTGI